MVTTDNFDKKKVKKMFNNLPASLLMHLSASFQVGHKSRYFTHMYSVEKILDHAALNIFLGTEG